MLVPYAMACGKQSRDQTAKGSAKDNRDNNQQHQQPQKDAAKQSGQCHLGLTVLSLYPADTSSQDTNKCDDADLRSLIESTLSDQKMSALAASNGNASNAHELSFGLRLSVL
jgi:hypothetical protein